MAGLMAAVPAATAAAPEAVILAGGLGTRLRAVVPDLPKPLAPVAGQPFLKLVLARLARQGVRRAVLSLGYRAEAFAQTLGDAFAGVALVHEIESRPLGTGGAIRAALARCRGDAALVLNGDTFLEFDLAAAEDRWHATGRPVLLGCQVADTARYGRLQVEAGRLVGMTEKGIAGPGLINSGHYLLPRTLFDGLELPEAFSFENDFLLPQLARRPIEVLEVRGRFIDIGVPEDYTLAQTLLADLAQLARSVPSADASA
jgi:D-glycero-alpha-D-manno-heptose 1-phosphate guanylyltransferase